MNPRGSVWIGRLAAACLLCVPLAHGEPDDAQQAWLDLVRVAATWENLSGGAAWIERGTSSA